MRWSVLLLALSLASLLACQPAQRSTDHLPPEERRQRVGEEHPRPEDRPVEAAPPPGEAPVGAAPEAAPDATAERTPPRPAEPEQKLPGPLPEGVTTEMIAEGRKVYMGLGRCQACHGINGRGTIQGPPLTGPQWLHIDGSYPELVRIIRDGVTRPRRYPLPMPPMGGAPLSDENLRTVAAYVWSLQPAAQ